MLDSRYNAAIITKRREKMSTYNYSQMKLKNIPKPIYDNVPVPVLLEDKTMEERKQKILSLMNKNAIDTIVVYCDLEHGSNFEYLTGFVTRFEESLLVLHKNGEAYLLLGNENTKFKNYTRLDAQVIHVPYFSLPNQPMGNTRTLTEMLANAGISAEHNIGLVGWKNFTSAIDDNSQMFDLPYFIVESVKSISKNVINATAIFIDPDTGARSTNNANEIAHYEFGASLASDCVLRAMDNIELGKTDMEMGNYLNAYGQHNNVVAISSSGERFYKANIYPTNKKIVLGDKVSLTAGFKGGLSSRSAYAVACREELPEDVRDYQEKVAVPYFTSIVCLIENLTIGKTGGEIYDLIESVLPQKTYYWELNPGHLGADEEWMASPMYSGSTDTIKSGMIIQTDIIPSVKGYGGASAEATICIADEALRKDIESMYPELWERIVARKEYMKDNLGIQMPDEVLALSSTVAYYRPYLLSKDEALVKVVE